MPSKILIVGGTGLVGTRLTEVLKSKGYEINTLTTSATRADQDGYFYWNPKDEYVDLKALEGVDYIINLAGAGVADKRWSKKRKKEIYDSRVKTTALLCERAKNIQLKAYVSASAVGIYGFDTKDKLLTEDSPQSDDFLAEVVQGWEREAQGFEQIADRVALLRIGVVLSTRGGALKEMSLPFKLGFGSPLGSGKQWMSWIHMDDLVNMFLFVLEKEITGTFNAVGPAPATNSDFSRTLAKVYKKPMWMPKVPAFILRIIFGELANIVLGGNRVQSEKIQKVGFQFQYPDLPDALKNLIDGNR